MSSRKDALERQLRSISDRLAVLESRPAEPEFEDEPTVVRFDLRYPDTDRLYSFAAIRVGDHWYTTGNPRYGKNHFTSWEAMFDDLDIDNRVVGQVWLVTGYEELS